ncbi:LuxR C-terminal-related transcriptional regulator (plasmid) [Streptomycetaceae bacterium NBC_01309]
MGRSAELAELRALLTAEERLVSLVGIGGMGKTRLAGKAAADWPMWCAASADRGPALFAELAPVQEQHLVEGVLLRAASIGAPVGRSPLHALAQHFGSMNCLLVIDNCEHLTAEVARVAEELLALCPGVRILATSREPIGVVGEHVWQVPPLRTCNGDSDAAAPEARGLSDAAQLFHRRALQRAPTLALDEANRNAMECIAAGLDGIPLAIELAAARARRQSPVELAAELQRWMLNADDPTRVERHRTMRRSLEWSHELLSTGESVLFRRLAVFVGGWTLEAAEQVCADTDLPAHTVLDLLTSLIDKSFVETIGSAEAHGSSRFRLLNPVKQFATEKLLGEEPLGNDSVAARHRLYYRDLAERADDELWTLDPANRARLEAEAPNMRAALEHGCEYHPHDALRLAAALGAHWRVAGQYAEGAHALSAALAHAPATSDYARARALAMHAIMTFWLGDLATSVTRAQEAIAVAVEIDDDRAHAHALARLATAKSIVSPLEARPDFERAVAYAQSADDPIALGDALSSLAMSYCWQDDYPAMERAAARVDAVARPIGFNSVVFWNLWGRSHRARIEGDLALARHHANEMLQLSIDDDVMLRSAAVEVAALIDALEGNGDAGRAAAFADLERSRHDAVRWGAGGLLHALSVCDLATGRIDSAARWATRLYERESGTAGYLAWHAQEVLMHCALARLDADAARLHADRLAETAEVLGNRRAKATVRLGQAHAAILDGCPNTAEEAALQALAVVTDNEWWTDVITTLELLAVTARHRDRRQRALRLFAAAEEARSQRRLVRVTGNGAWWRAQVAGARADLSPAVADDAWSQGARMPLLRAAEYAMRGRGPRSTYVASSRLTPTERRVVACASRGLSNADIARELVMAPGTVKNHLANAFSKLGVKRRTELVALHGDTHE